MSVIWGALPFIAVSSPLWADVSSRQAPQGPLGILVTFFPLIAFAGIFYMLLFRPQQKANRERKKMLDSIKRGDRVLTSGGLYGHIVNIKGETLDLKLAENVKVEINRSFITRVFALNQSVSSSASPKVESPSS